MGRLSQDNAFTVTDTNTRECGKMGKGMDKVALIVLKCLVQADNLLCDQASCILRMEISWKVNGRKIISAKVTDILKEIVASI